MALFNILRRQYADVEEAARTPTVQPPSRNEPVRAGFIGGVPIGGATKTNPAATTAGLIDRADYLDQLMQAYLSCPHASAAIDSIARTITAGGIEAVPNAMDREGTEETPPAPQAVKDIQSLLSFVNQDEDIRQMMRSVITDLMIFGDSYTEVVWLGKRPVALYMLDPQTMTVQTDEHGAVESYLQTMKNGLTADFEPHEVIHVKFDAPGSGIYGVSPTAKNILPITTWLFTSALQKETMKRGDPLRAWVDWPIAMSDAEMKRFQQQYQIRNLGSQNIGNLLETKGGAELKELSMNQLAQWMDIKQQSRDEIYTGYGVPPSKVGVIEAGNLGAGTGTSQDRALALDTPIPTPTGWTTMGDLSIRDVVFDEYGESCQVTGTENVTDAQSWRLHFSDGTYIDCADDHLWVTWTAKDRKSFGRNQSRVTGLPENWPTWRSADRVDGCGPEIRKTSDILDTLVVGSSRNNHSIPVTGSLQCAEFDAPMDPYVLGVWLGDGTAQNGLITTGVRADHEAICKIMTDDGHRIMREYQSSENCWGIRMAIGPADAKVSEELRCVVDGCTHQKTNRTKFGWCSGHLARYYRSNNKGDIRANVPLVEFGNMRSTLISMDLLNNKHIPTEYLRGSVDQRLALLRGLMDTDGGWNNALDHRVVFTNTNKNLIDGVVELARSLGQKPSVFEGLSVKDGVVKGKKYQVAWTPTVQVFRMPRKAEKFSVSEHGMELWMRTIVGAEKIPDEPMKCIRVDSPNAMYLAGEGMIPTHNTFNVNTCGPIGELVLEKFTFALLQQAYSVTDWHLQFGQVDWRDDEIIETIIDTRIRNGRFTLNRARAIIGEPPVPGGDNPFIVDRQAMIMYEDLDDYSKASVKAVSAKGTSAVGGTQGASLPAKAAATVESDEWEPGDPVHYSRSLFGPDQHSQVLEAAWRNDYNTKRRALLADLTTEPESVTV